MAAPDLPIQAYRRDEHQNNSIGGGMSGDWIKFAHVTPDKPEVHVIASTLNIAPEHAVGCLLRLWIWADQQSLNGHAISVTESTINGIARHAGMATAMRQVGWLKGEDGALTFPNFTRHNGETSKKRALNTSRKQASRSRSEGDKNVTREEKRRDSVSSTRKPQKSSSKALTVKGPTTTTPEGEEVQKLAAATWAAYDGAYLGRYSVHPVRNAQVNSLIVALVKKLGKEAPEVASYFLSHNRGLYVSARHDLTLLVRDASGLRTDWATGVNHDATPQQQSRGAATMSALEGK